MAYSVLMNTETFIAIGDITADSFITLKDAAVHCDIASDTCTITMRWGDKIPYKDVTVVPAVGNSPNAAVSASRLGLPTGLVSYIGDDRGGDECIRVLENEGIDTSLVAREPGKTTNHHYVLSYEAERTILVRHESFSYEFPDLPDTATWLYLSSVGQSGEPLHDRVVRWVADHPNANLVFQPGTFQMELGYDRLKDVYRAARLFVCNKQEAQRILKTDETDMKTLLTSLRDLGPDIVSITDGPAGAYATDGNAMHVVPPYPDIAPPKERTGAGDAYTSTLAAFLAKGRTLADALLRAPINAMSVVQHVGAQRGLLTEEELERYLEKAPDDYAAAVL